MKQVIVASRNPVKINAARNAFIAMFPQWKLTFAGVEIESNVRAQPLSDKETRLGAFNRVTLAATRLPDADFWVGIEGGVEWHGPELAAFAWIVIQSDGLVGKSRTGTFYLPEAIARLIREGKELGEADDLVFSESNSKQNQGAIGLLTNDVINRTSLYEHAIKLALVPFLNLNLYRSR